MRLRPDRRTILHIGLAGLLALPTLTPRDATGQEARQRPGDSEKAPDAGLVLVFPTGDRATGSLLVEVAGPAEVPVGRSYEYRIKATNISRNLVLDEVAVVQTKQEGFSLEKSDPQPEEGQGGATRWAIGKLAPGESRTISVTAQADKEGEAAGCLQAEYKPALCLTTRFVKPDLKVTKEAPEATDLCDLLTYRYAVANTGSGPARGVKLRDELPEGLAADDGRNSLEFEVGDLQPGQSRDFSARVQPSRTGDFASRAVAVGANDLEARSNRPSTSVRQARLAVEIAGPDSMYVDRPMTYRIEVKNEGDAPARAARLEVQADRVAKVVRTSKAEPGGAAPKVEGQALSWDLGTIEPGKSVAVSMTAVGRIEADLEHVATATAACERGGDLAKGSTATRTARTQILTLPALLLSTVDRVDPVRVGDVEVYRITVLNQGSGADEHVKVTCSLPEQLSYVDAQGNAPASADGSEVTLGPIDRLAPHGRAVWDLRVKCEKPGDLRLETRLTSAYLSEDRPAVSIEPTRVIGRVSDRRPEAPGGEASAEPAASPKATQDADEGVDKPSSGAAEDGGRPAADGKPAPGE